MLNCETTSQITLAEVDPPLSARVEPAAWIKASPSGRICREPPFPQPDFWPARRQTGAVKARIEHVMGGHYDVSWTIFQWSRRPFFALSSNVADTGSDPLSFPLPGIIINPVDTALRSRVSPARRFWSKGHR